MYIECDNCGYIVDAKTYHVRLPCPKCNEGTMKEAEG